MQELRHSEISGLNSDEALSILTFLCTQKNVYSSSHTSLILNFTCTLSFNVYEINITLQKWWGDALELW